MSAADAAGPRDELLVDAPEPWGVPLPRGLDAAAGADWLDAARASTAEAVAHWPSEAVELVPAVLAHALDARGDEGVVLLVFSPTAAACATLRVAVLPSPGLAAIADELRAATTSLVTRVDDAGLGSGAEWVHGAPLPGAAGERLAGLQWAFADDEVLVLATLDPVPPPMLAHVVVPARECVLGIRRVRDGVDWRATALPADVGARRGETWPTPTGERAGGDAGTAA